MSTPTTCRFSFGPWNISEGGDPFGPATRPAFDHEAKFALYRPLGFEGVQYRLEAEYGAPSRLENASWECFRWLPPGTATAGLKLPTGSRLAYDSTGQPGILFPSAWTQRYFTEQNGGIELLELPAPTTHS